MLSCRFYLREIISSSYKQRTVYEERYIELSDYCCKLSTEQVMGFYIFWKKILLNFNRTVMVDRQPIASRKTVYACGKSINLSIEFLWAMAVGGIYLYIFEKKL